MNYTVRLTDTAKQDLRLYSIQKCYLKTYRTWVSYATFSDMKFVECIDLSLKGYDIITKQQNRKVLQKADFKIRREVF